MTIGEAVTIEALEEDPYPIYARLREDEPVSLVESVGLWLVTRHHDVDAVVHDPETYTAETEPSTLNRTFGRNMLASEGAYHQRIRSIVEPAFRPGAVRPYADDVIAPEANALIDAFADRGSVDLAKAFCEPLSVRTLKRVLGLAEMDDETLERWFEGLGIGASNFEGDPEKQTGADAASREVNEAIQPILDRVEAEPDASILSRLVHEEVDGERLTREEIQSNLKVMIVGGMQEPGDAIGIALWALLSHPQQAKEVRANPDAMIRPAVEEALRWHSPVGTSTRQTTKPTTLAGVDLKEGALIAAVVSSANRDGRRWEDPDLFDVHRKQGAHLAFAAGAHMCVGAWLARAECRTAFRVLFERLPHLRLDGDDPIRLSGWEFRRPLRLDVAWDA
ncbi:MAG: cytochrome P450 [Actinomycetota bacterium]